MMTDIIYDEVIIGAGIAGLYWCYKTKPVNYIILEKDNRIGGRIYNVMWNNHQISLGGGIIKANNEFTKKLTQELNLELIRSKSQYYMNDFDKTEDHFHEKNKLLTKYLKKKYYDNQIEIKNQKLNWNEFLNIYVNIKIRTIINSHSLYKSYDNADIESVLNNEIEELLRTRTFETYYIKQNGYTDLLNALKKIIPETNIRLNQNVINITQDNELYIIQTNTNIFQTKKIILATETKTNIIFNLNPQNKINLENLYKMTNNSNYIRIYSYHKNRHNLKMSHKTSGLPGKVIYINENILMCCYTEEDDANKLNDLLEKNTPEEQIQIIYNLLLKCNINVTKPDDIIYKYWKTGIHYNTIDYDINKKYELLQNLKENNIIVIGESISDTHGWVDSALESVENIFKIFI